MEVDPSVRRQLIPRHRPIDKRSKLSNNPTWVDSCSQSAPATQNDLLIKAVDIKRDMTAVVIPAYYTLGPSFQAQLAIWPAFNYIVSISNTDIKASMDGGRWGRIEQPYRGSFDPIEDQVVVNVQIGQIRGDSFRGNDGLVLMDADPIS